MILFVNVMLTDKVFNVYYHGRRVALQNKVDVFKYTLASYAVIPWEHVVVYLKLDDMYEARRGEIEAYIHQLFPGVRYYSFRNERQKDWQKSVGELFNLQSDGLVWFTCDDNHVFVDYDLQALEQLRQGLIELQKDHVRVSAAVSNWPEYVPCIQKNFKSKWAAYTTTPFAENDWFYAVNSNRVESIQIVNLALIKTWWFEKDYGDVFAPRTNSPKFTVYAPTDVVNVIPKREIVRHYDGYSHLGAGLNTNPPLFIPEGFFEGNIRINYCADVRRAGHVNVNPFAEYNYNVHHDGPDMHCSVEELPLFWRDKISIVEVAKKYSEVEILAASNARRFESASEFWRVPVQEFMHRYAISFRSDATGEVHVSKIQNGKLIDHFSILKRSAKRPKLSVILLERRLGFSGRNSLNSLVRQLGRRDDFEIVVVGLHGGHDPEMLAASDTYITLSSELQAQNDTYSVAAAYNIAASYSSGALIAFSDTYSLFSTSFVTSVLTNAANLISSGTSFMLRAIEEGVSIEGAINIFAQPPATLVVAAQDLIKVGGFDESPELRGEKFAVSELSARLLLLQVKEFVLPQVAAIWRVPDNSYRLLNPSQFKPVSPLPRLISPEFIRFTTGVSPVARVGEVRSELENLNLLLLSGNLQAALEGFNLKSCQPDTALVLAAIGDRIAGVDRGEFGRLEAAAEKAVENRPALSLSTALLLYFSGQFAAAEQWIWHGLSAAPLYSKLWLLLCEVKVAQKANQQELLGVTLEGVRSFPLQQLFFARSIEALRQ